MMGDVNHDSVIVRFLDHYKEYGSMGHLLAAQALRDTILSAREPAKRKLLAVKIYAEFMAAIEDLGALCVAIRHREGTTGLIHAT
jgi:hypothetical protein